VIALRLSAMDMQVAQVNREIFKDQYLVLWKIRGTAVAVGFLLVVCNVLVLPKLI
jgi:hypothetical protein